MFRSWNLDEEMLFEEEGCRDDDSYAKLLALHPVILRELVTESFSLICKRSILRLFPQRIAATNYLSHLLQLHL